VKLVFVCSLLSSCIYLPNFTNIGSIVRKPYLQQVNSDSALIIWRSKSLKTPSLRYGRSPDNFLSFLPASAVKITIGNNESLPPDSRFPGVQYEVKLKNLKPATEYFYKVYEDSEPLGKSAISSFRTYPQSISPTNARIWIIGDTGMANKAQKMAYNQMLAYTKPPAKAVDLILHMGDIAYPDGTDKELSRTYFKIYEKSLQSIACWPTLGNHGCKSSNFRTGLGPYFTAFSLPVKGECSGFPSGTESYYSFNFGRIHFICLNSNESNLDPDSPMSKWLKKDLQFTRENQNSDWIVAYMHHPPYSKGTHDSDKEKQLIMIRQKIIPILEKGGADMVISGHSHDYSRSFLLHGAYSTPTVGDGKVIIDKNSGNPKIDTAYRKPAGITTGKGTVYMVAGHGGAWLKKTIGQMPVMACYFKEHGSVIIDINGNSLKALMINSKGQIRDQFTLEKK